MRPNRAVRARAAGGLGALMGGRRAAAAFAARYLGQLFRSELFLWIAHNFLVSWLLVIPLVMGFRFATFYFEVELE